MRTPIIAVTFLAAALAGHAAHAHAFLDHASPVVGSTVASAPHEVTLSFTQKLEPVFSSVEVTNSSGTRVDTGEPHISGNTMRVGLKDLAPGTYQVVWRALSVDTHKTQGSFTFRVGGS
jgi:copper resistance protein C